MHEKRIKIAIDGPAGAGKSTVARLVAGKLGYVYVDTGAMYRAVTWYVLSKGIDPADRERIGEAVQRMRLQLRPSENGQQVWVDEDEVTGSIRSSEVTGLVSRIAQIPEVRAYLTDIQKGMSSDGGIVMDGRDIGTQVLPDAELKVFLTATVEERANRRHKELLESGNPVPLERLRSEIAERDRMDREREVSPLKQADDAIFLDCTSLSIGQVVDRIVELSMSIINEARV